MKFNCFILLLLLSSLLRAQDDVVMTVKKKAAPVGHDLLITPEIGLLSNISRNIYIIHGIPADCHITVIYKDGIARVQDSILTLMPVKPCDSSSPSNKVYVSVPYKMTSPNNVVSDLFACCSSMVIIKIINKDGEVLDIFDRTCYTIPVGYDKYASTFRNGMITLLNAIQKQ
jgi:hypothetical protein